ncbi:hypothetical protein TNCV_1640031 [Trichonephila clavipes]|nr:hypothetical protein TNCV_1640031 [Trichonephila clavipes]
MGGQTRFSRHGRWLPVEHDQSFGDSDPKKPEKDPTLPDSFRPISLLPVLSKITEKIIQKRLCQHLNDNDILIPQQHGFRSGFSTSHQLLQVVEYIDRIS